MEKEVKIRLSKKQKEELKKAAESLGISQAALCRSILIKNLPLLQIS